MKPLISFIVTYHNEPAAWLEACVESILALPLEQDEAEVVVVDDGSSSSPSSITGARLIRQEQAGLSVARNTGISHSEGSYIQFVDADDYLIPSAYETVLGQLRSQKADVVLFRMTSSSRMPSHASRPKSFVPADYLLHHNLRAAACGYAFRRDILGELRFHPGLFHEDELFTPLLFLKAGNLLSLDAEAYFYRQHEGTITHTRSAEKIQKRLDDIHFILKQLQSLKEPLLERRIKQLTVDYLQKTWTLTSSFRELRRRTRQLHQEGFLPLPLRSYSLRYLFASLILRFIA